MKVWIQNARIFPDNSSASLVLIEGRKVVAITDTPGDFTPDLILDAGGRNLLPGFVDIHVHGGGDAYTNMGTPEAITTLAHAHLLHGTTTLLPTTWTAPIEELERATDAVAAVASQPDTTVAGIHLEGPFLSPLQGGAQDGGEMLTAAGTDWESLVDRHPGLVHMMGAAPETPGALTLGDGLRQRGIVASIAHSNAYQEEIDAAIAHGYADVTHLYSCCSQFTRRGGFRIPGVVECGLAYDELTVQVIADGCHLPLPMIRTIYRAKGSENMILITDALEFAAGSLPSGIVFHRGGQDVILEDGVCKLASRQAFAGSAATTDRLLKVALSAGIPFRDAVRMLTENPARRIGLDKKKGRLAPGYDADFVLWDNTEGCVGVVSYGKPVFWPEHK